jgi:hypothetical protein
MMSMDSNGMPASNTIADLQQLSREYASFSRSRAGLGNVLGGIAGLLVFGAIWLWGHSVAVVIISIGLTLLWLIGKTVLRQQLYRPFGQASERWEGSQRRQHIAVTIIFTLGLLGFAAWLMADGWLSRPAVAWPYLIFCLVTPILAWWSLYTIPEAILGFDLLFMCAIVASGHTPDLLGLLAAPAYALAMIPLGLSEHRQFQGLKRRLQARSGTAA